MVNFFFIENIGSNVFDINIVKGEFKWFVFEMVYLEGEIKDIIVKFMLFLIIL